MKQWLPTQHHAIQIIHQLGNHETDEWHTFYTSLKIPALIFSFHHEIEYCYAAADLVLCRAGAGTLFELIFFQKPSIVVPLETNHNNHQLFNALACAQTHPQLIHVIRQKSLHHTVAPFSDLVEQKFKVTQRIK